MENWTPKVPTLRVGIDPAAPEGDRTVRTLLQGARILCELQDGENWHPHPAGGVIIAHPMREPVWVREEGGKVVREVLKL